MKSLFLSVAIALICVNSTSFAQESLGPKAAILVDFTDGTQLKLVNVLQNPKDGSDLLFDFGVQNKDHAIDARFHNATEAGWFLQFVKQLDGEVELSYKGKLKKSGTPVENYIVTLKQQNQPIAIAWTPQDKVKSSCVAGVTSTVVALTTSEPNPNLDDFSDIFRTKLEEQGFWVGDEGAKNMKSKAKTFSCPK